MRAARTLTAPLLAQIPYRAGPQNAGVDDIFVVDEPAETDRPELRDQQEAVLLVDRRCSGLLSMPRISGVLAGLSP
jgi:hypothetical protein